MMDQHKLETLKQNVERIVKEGTDRGAPKVPTTPLERHAFELGRLSILKWLAPDQTPFPPAA